MEMVRNPSVMQEMMRTHDRALSNLEVPYHTTKVPIILNLPPENQGNCLGIFN